MEEILEVSLDGKTNIEKVPPFDCFPYFLSLCQNLSRVSFHYSFSNSCVNTLT